MAKGLGFSDPQRTSPVNPDGNPNLHRGNMRGPQVNQKYTPRRSIYHWMAQDVPGSNYGSLGYGTRRRGKKNNDSGSLPEAYLNYIER